MTSLLCVQQPGGAINVCSDDLHHKIVRDSESKIVTTYVPLKPTIEKYARRPTSTPNPQLRDGNVEPKNLVGQALKLQEWVNSKSVKHVQERANVEARTVRSVYTGILNEQDTFVSDLQSYCKYNDFLHQRKKELLHKKWSEKVSEPIQSAIIAKVDSDAYEELRKRKHELYREYIEHVNTKGHVFLDSFDPEEYYPLAVAAARPPVVESLSAKHRALNDPTLLQSRRRHDEERVELACTSGARYSDKGLDSLKLPPMPLGRHTMNSIVWTGLPLSDIDSVHRQLSRRRMLQIPYASSINFEQWSSESSDDPNVFDKEMRLQKKKRCPQPPFARSYPQAANRKRIMEGYVNDVMISHTLPLQRHGSDPGSDSYSLSQQHQQMATNAQEDGQLQIERAPFSDTSTYKDSYIELTSDPVALPDSMQPIV